MLRLCFDICKNYSTQTSWIGRGNLFIPFLPQSKGIGSFKLNLSIIRFYIWWNREHQCMPFQCQLAHIVISEAGELASSPTLATFDVKIFSWFRKGAFWRTEYQGCGRVGEAFYLYSRELPRISKVWFVSDSRWHRKFFREKSRWKWWIWYSLQGKY